jgi:hypothetical protein
VPELPRPPVPPLLGEHPAVVEPALREMPPFQGLEVSDARAVDVDEGDDRAFAELAARAREAAFADARVRERLGDRRHAVIGVARSDEKRARTVRLVLVVYCYDDGLAYEVGLAEQDGELAVRDVTTADYQPALSDEEVEEAIQLAGGHRQVVDRLQPGYEAHTLLTSAVEPGDEHYGRRRVSVVFGPPDERLPRVHAVVDLGSRNLVWVAGREGEQS